MKKTQTEYDKLKNLSKEEKEKLDELKEQVSHIVKSDAFKVFEKCLKPMLEQKGFNFTSMDDIEKIQFVLTISFSP